MRIRMLVLAVIAAVVISWLAIRQLNTYARPSHTLGVTKEHKLAECPDKPNCVSSTSPRPGQNMPPLALVGSASQAMNELEAIIRAMPRSRIVTADGRYLHAEFRSRLFGFVDDVEFLIDEANAVIHFRAASRVGYSDLGVNRRRMTELCQQFESRNSRDE
jgi:uncharacterized protein (DUF1499 family)